MAWRQSYANATTYCDINSRCQKEKGCVGEAALGPKMPPAHWGGDWLAAILSNAVLNPQGYFVSQQGFRICYMIHGVRGSNGAPMTSSISKRSVIINGHKTSVSLEAGFWNDLKEIAHGQRVPLSKLVTKIDGTREQSNLSSAIRLFVLDHIRNEHERTKVSVAHRGSR